jgi:hypothetical protein
MVMSNALSKRRASAELAKASRHVPTRTFHCRSFGTLPKRRRGAPSESAGQARLLTRFGDRGGTALASAGTRETLSMARMTTTRHARRGRARRYLSLVLVLLLVQGTVPMSFAYATDEPASPAEVQPAQTTPEELQRLVAPIALYPDELIAQVLAAATYPEQIVEADRWMQEHGKLQGQELAQEVDKQPWDPSIKALTQFPSVLANMDKNLSWTSSLGDAYVNHQPDVMNAIQVMRQRAQQAGNLQTTSQQKVVQQGPQIVVQPANPEVVYVPQYDPWIVYGAPLVAWPGWYWYPGLFVPGPGIVFGVGFGIGLFAGFGWGWGHWGCDWGHHAVVFNHNTFISRGRTFTNRRTFERERGSFAHASGFHGAAGSHGGGGFHGAGVSHGAAGFRGAEQHASASRGAPGGRWGAFSGFDHGGATRNQSMRGSSSWAHGGGFGGGSRGGGFGGGVHGGGFGGGHGGGHGGHR